MLHVLTYIHISVQSTKSDANLQLSKLDRISLKDNQNAFGTHHQLLTLMWIIQSDTTAAIKQRALQVFSFACTAASAGLHPKDQGDHPHKQTMSVQTRRRLLGFQGDEDLENEEIHAPKLVQLTPLLLVDVLAAEFHLSVARDEKSRSNNDSMWMTQVQEEIIDPKTAKKKEKKQKKITVDKTIIDVDKVFDEVVFLMKRVIDLVESKPDVVDLFEDHSQEIEEVREWINALMQKLPAILTEQGAALRGAGVTRDVRAQHHFCRIFFCSCSSCDDLLQITEGLRTQTEIDVMLQVMGLDEMDLDRPLDESDEESFLLIRKIRQTQTATLMHRLLGTIIGLPIDSLRRERKLRDDTESEGDQAQHALLAKIERMKLEQSILSADILALEDESISNVAKTYILRLFAIYAENAEFARRLMKVIGPEKIIDFLMHGDSNLQVASSVCLYQLARQEPACLDALETTRGGIHYVGTQMTHPDKVNVMTHRIAIDLLVETSKRIELRKPMVQAGLVGPLKQLADIYARVMLDRAPDTEAREFHEKIEAEHNEYAAAMQSTSKKKHFVIESTNEITAWCPFELKGPRLLSEHILMSIMKIFGEFAEEDVFRASFVGQHNGLLWLRDTVYKIPEVDVQIMTMRVLLGLVAEPFGLYDIIDDRKMLSYYSELMSFKRDKKMPIGSVMALSSKDGITRIKQHRVADFLGIVHRQSGVADDNVVLCEKLPLHLAEEHQHEHMHDADIMEITRDAVFEECLDLMYDACTAENEALRTSGVSVLSSLASTVARLEDQLFRRAEACMTSIREWYTLNTTDRVLYSEIVSSWVIMKRRHREMQDVGPNFVEALVCTPISAAAVLILRHTFCFNLFV
eukprot:SAG31_NODE_60_length_29419_cov_39.876398_19_plen_861_part_00